MANDPNNVQGPPPVGPNFQNPNPDLRSMEELLQAPTDGVGDAIVVPLILANQFKLKVGLINLVTAIAFHGFENDDPHSHIRRFTKITQTVKHNYVPSDVVKLLLFPFSLEGAARTWLEKEPLNSITTWNDLVSKFVNRLFPLSKTTNLRNEITRFQQRFGETFPEAWDRFKDLLNKCPHHGFSPLHQIDTSYNSLNQSEQDSLNSVVSGNFLTKNTQEALTIIKNKSKVQTSRNKPQISSASGSSTQDAAITALTKQVEDLVSSMNRPVNSIQNGCETCGGPRAYYECQAVDYYTQDVYATTRAYNQGGNTYQPQAQEKERYKADIRCKRYPTSRESQLYDEFEHFRQIKGETIHVYYVRFTKLINDMRNIKMTMPRMQLNSKFVNNMLPEWSRFITEVKLNRGLKESNFDQLYAYLKQHEVHASENRMMMERFIQPTNDPLALVSNASVQQYPTQSSMSPQSSNEPSPADNFQLDSGSSSTENLIENGRVVVQDVRGRYNANNQGRPFQRNNARGNVVAGNAGGQNRGGNVNPGQAKPIKCYNCNGLGHIARELLDEEQFLFLAGEQVTNFDDDVDDPPEKDLALNVDHIFKADQCDAFDSDVDEAPNIQTMFMVQDHDTFVDHMDEYHEVHEMQNDVQHNYVVDSDAEYTSDSNIIPYNQYVEDNEENVGVQSRLANKPDKVVNDSLTSELARYKELVGEYEKRAKFELTDREQKIDEQMRIIISDRNRKETSLKSELHSVQMQLRSTLGHYKSKTEEVTILKKDFKQKEDKFLEEFLDIKRLKEKVEDRLYKQDQSVQTVHMLCKPKSFYDEKKKVEIGYKNPLYLTHAKQVQYALYNGHEIVKTNHAPPVVHVLEDTREITRKRMLEKMKSPLCVENKVKIAPSNYSKENLLATFAPQRDLTTEQIFWSKDVNEIKRAETSVPKPLSALTVIKILETQLQEKDNAIRNLKAQVSKMNDRSCETYNAKDVTALIEQNECVRVELEKVPVEKASVLVSLVTLSNQKFLRKNNDVFSQPLYCDHWRYAFSSMNILNYTSVSSDYFSASSESSSFNSSENSNDNMIPPVFEIGKCSDKMYLKHHEEQVEDILNYLEELSFRRIEKMEEGRNDRMIIRRNSDELKIKLERICTQIIKL
ncbi:retrovirus-related pol polyprotein from transposon TNT 1-94 [Tanacetum coccineum]